MIEAPNMLKLIGLKRILKNETIKKGDFEGQKTNHSGKLITLDYLSRKYHNPFLFLLDF